eukprot:11162733-Lingulodinium_polyedra.AAC.1
MGVTMRVARVWHGPWGGDRQRAPEFGFGRAVMFLRRCPYPLAMRERHEFDGRRDAVRSRFPVRFLGGH